MRYYPPWSSYILDREAEKTANGHLEKVVQAVQAKHYPSRARARLRRCIGDMLSMREFSGTPWTAWSIF